MTRRNLVEGAQFFEALEKLDQGEVERLLKSNPELIKFTNDSNASPLWKLFEAYSAEISPGNKEKMKRIALLLISKGVEVDEKLNEQMNFVGITEAEKEEALLKNAPAVVEAFEVAEVLTPQNAFKKLLEKYNQNQPITDQDLTQNCVGGGTVLHYMAGERNNSIVSKVLAKALAGKGIDVRSVVNNEGKTPLHIAAKELNFKFVAELIENGLPQELTGDERYASFKDNS
jgi:hypothetical protein